MRASATSHREGQHTSKVQCYPVTPRRGLAVLSVLALLILSLSGCASDGGPLIWKQDHPVQPAPKDWTLPQEYAHCTKGEQITWPDARVTITVECPGQSLFIDRKTKAVVDLDSLDFRRKK